MPKFEETLESMELAETNEYLGSIAAMVDAKLSVEAPKMTFAIVFWVKERPGDSGAIAVTSPPDTRDQSTEALQTAADYLKGADAELADLNVAKDAALKEFS